MVPLLPAAPLCAPDPQTAQLAAQSSLHSTGRRALDDQEQTGLLGTL